MTNFQSKRSIKVSDDQDGSKQKVQPPLMKM